MALRTLLATVDETLPVLPASTHREVRGALLAWCSATAFPVSLSTLGQVLVLPSWHKHSFWFPEQAQLWVMILHEINFIKIAAWTQV